MIQRYSCIQIPALTVATYRYFCNKIRFYFIEKEIEQTRVKAGHI